MNYLSEDLLYEGVSIDIHFGNRKPGFGDLFVICGEPHLQFPRSGIFAFESLDDLQFEQVDDYFGVRSLAGDGADVVVWLYPLVAGEPVYHHPGPFDGLQLEFNVLGNPSRHINHFMQCVERFSALGETTVYRGNERAVGDPELLNSLHEDIRAITEHWLSQGIVVGSDEALEIDF